MEAPAPIAEGGSDDVARIARNIVLARRLADDMSQMELARRLEITRQQLAQWEHAIVTPRVVSLKRIALTTHQTLDWFTEDHPHLAYLLEGQ